MFQHYVSFRTIDQLHLFQYRLGCYLMQHGMGEHQYANISFRTRKEWLLEFEEWQQDKDEEGTYVYQCFTSTQEFPIYVQKHLEKTLVAGWIDYDWNRPLPSD